MKLQLDSPLIETVRTPRTHRIPKEIILQVMIFFGIFAMMQFAEMVVMLVFLWDSFMEWSMELAQQVEAGAVIDQQEFTDKLYALMTEPVNLAFSLLSTGAGTIFVLLYCRIVEGRKLYTLGFNKKHAFAQYGIGLLAGFVSFAAVVGISFLCGGLRFNEFRGQFTGTLLLIFVGYLIQGMSEEVICRGFMMTSTLRHHNVWWAVGINSVFFGIFHAANNGFSAFALLNLILYAAVASLYVLRTNNLWGACAFHSIWNFAQGNFFGLPVSGMDSGDTIFSMSLNGSSILNGGAFGLEASIATTIVMGIWIAVLLFVPNPFTDKEKETVQAA